MFASHAQQFFIKFLITTCAALAVLACGQSDDDLAESVENFEQKLELTLDGQPLVIALQEMDIYLTEDDKYPEKYEISGEGVMLAGTFPKNVRVDYGEEWDKLVGALITISPQGGGRYEKVDCAITLPGMGSVKVTGGTFKVEKFLEGYDGDTPLLGLIEIEVQTPAGPKTLKGKFSVKASTWG